MRLPRLAFVTAFVAALLVSLGSCAETGVTPTQPSTPRAETVRVYAASSLSGAAIDLRDAYEAASGNNAVFEIAGSPQLATQIENGAPADVFVSADIANIDRVTAANRAAGTPVVVARTFLAILVSAKSRVSIGSLSDLAQPGALIALGAPGVPVGDYARASLERAGVRVQPVTFEANVSGIVAKVQLGEVDAGIVYRSDPFDPALAKQVTIPASVNVEAQLSAVAVSPVNTGVKQEGSLSTDVAQTTGELNAAGQSFVSFLASPNAQAVFKKHGFEIPL